MTSVNILVLTFGLLMLSFKMIAANNSENGPKQCYVCLSFASGKRNNNCPGDRELRSLSTIYKANCTGVCVIKTLVQQKGVVARGCSDNIYYFPKRVPKDGCYNDYMDTICICRKHLCNTKPLGKPQNKELDYLDEMSSKDGLNSFAAHTLSGNLFISIYLLIGIMLTYL